MALRWSDSQSGVFLKTGASRGSQGPTCLISGEFADRPETVISVSSCRLAVLTPDLDFGAEANPAGIAGKPCGLVHYSPVPFQALAWPQD